MSKLILCECVNCNQSIELQAEPDFEAILQTAVDATGGEQVAGLILEFYALLRAQATAGPEVGTPRVNGVVVLETNYDSVVYAHSGCVDAVRSQYSFVSKVFPLQFDSIEGITQGSAQQQELSRVLQASSADHSGALANQSYLFMAILRKMIVFRDFDIRGFCESVQVALEAQRPTYDTLSVSVGSLHSTMSAVDTISRRVNDPVTTKVTQAYESANQLIQEHKTAAYACTGAGLGTLASTASSAVTCAEYVAFERIQAHAVRARKLGEKIIRLQRSMWGEGATIDASELVSSMTPFAEELEAITTLLLPVETAPSHPGGAGGTLSRTSSLHEPITTVRQPGDNGDNLSSTSFSPHPDDVSGCLGRWCERMSDWWGTVRGRRDAYYLADQRGQGVGLINSGDNGSDLSAVSILIEEVAAFPRITPDPSLFAGGIPAADFNRDNNLASSIMLVNAVSRLIGGQNTVTEHGNAPDEQRMYIAFQYIDAVIQALLDADTLGKKGNLAEWYSLSFAYQLEQILLHVENNLIGTKDAGCVPNWYTNNKNGWRDSWMGATWWSLQKKIKVSRLLMRGYQERLQANTWLRYALPAPFIPSSRGWRLFVSVLIPLLLLGLIVAFAYLIRRSTGQAYPITPTPIPGPTSTFMPGPTPTSVPSSMMPGSSSAMPGSSSMMPTPTSVPTSAMPGSSSAMPGSSSAMPGSSSMMMPTPTPTPAVGPHCLSSYPEIEIGAPTCKGVVANFRQYPPGTLVNDALGGQMSCVANQNAAMGQRVGYWALYVQNLFAAQVTGDMTYALLTKAIEALMQLPECQ